MAKTITLLDEEVVSSVPAVGQDGSSVQEKIGPKTKKQTAKKTQESSKPEKVNFSFNSWLALPDGTIARSARAIVEGWGAADQATFALYFYGFITAEEMMKMAECNGIDKIKVSVLDRFLTVQLKETKPMRIEIKSLGLTNQYKWYSLTSFCFDVKDMVSDQPELLKHLLPTLSAFCDLEEKAIKDGRYKTKKEEVLTKEMPLYDKLLKKLASMKRVFSSNKSTWKEVDVTCNAFSYLAVGFSPKDWSTVRV